MMPLTNIASYKFVPLDNLDELREQLADTCQHLDLKGTILLSEEGINQFLVGKASHINDYKDYMANDERFAGMSYRESFSKEAPFKKLRVKIRSEIVTIKDDTVKVDEPHRQSVSPKQFHEWLAAGKKMTVLDTRNGFEVELGAFDGTEHLHLKGFSEFPEAIVQLPESKKSEPMVIFCTGGIRCEKAAPVLERAGFQEVYQLEGGILNYFEQCGDDYFHGECFVFDERITVDGQINETGTLLCSLCQKALDNPDAVRELRPAERRCVDCQ